MNLSPGTLIFAVLSLTAGIVSLCLAVYLAPHWRNKGAGRLILLMTSVAVWALAYSMEFFSPGLDVTLWWVKVEYMGASWTGFLVLAFILTVTEKEGLLPKKTLTVLGALPVSEILLVLTNHYHHLMWKRVWLDESGIMPVIAFERGTGFWILVAFSYLMLIIATLVLITSLLSAKGITRKKLLAVLAGIAVPWAGNIIYIFGAAVTPLPDFTPIAFTISGLAFAWGLFRYQMLDLMPLAHETMIRGMGDPVIILDIKDRILEINPAARDAFDLEIASPGRHDLTSTFPALFRELMIHRRPDSTEKEISLKRRDETRDWHLRIFPLHTPKGKLVGWLITLRDITAYKKARAALIESERIHRTMLEAAPNPIVLYDQNGRATHVNPAFTRVFGWETDEILGKRIDFVPEDSLEATRIALKKTIEEKKVNHNFITRRLTKAGEIIDVSINSALCRTHDGSTASMVVNFTDITKIKQTEKALRKTQAFIQSIINAMPSALIGLDAKGRITHWNREASRITGVPGKNAAGLPLKKVFPQLSVHIPDLSRILETQQVKKISRITLALSAVPMVTDITIYPISTETLSGAVVRVDDISERVRLEEMMVQSEKMLSVGGLAAGMAHEINNPLAGIIQNIQVIKNRLTRDIPANVRAAQDCGIALDAVKAYAEKREILSMVQLAQDAGQRAAKIVSNMLSFSRKSGSRKAPCYIGELLDETIDLVQNDYRMKKQYDFRAIRIVKEYTANLPPVTCVKGEIQQVLLNILRNGAEAMVDAATSSPCFNIRCFRLQADIRIEIKDNGPGMDDETRKRIFEPFYTTKDVGLGTGLGLSVSYFIITENHDGRLAVESLPGRGTTFIITLPL